MSAIVSIIGACNAMHVPIPDLAFTSVNYRPDQVLRLLPLLCTETMSEAGFVINRRTRKAGPQHCVKRNRDLRVFWVSH